MCRLPEYTSAEACGRSPELARFQEPQSARRQYARPFRPPRKASTTAAETGSSSRIIARSMVFFSSRTLPGQVCDRSSLRVSSVIPRTDLRESNVVAVDKEIHQRKDVFLAIAQRRDEDGDDGEAVVKILAELVFAHRFFQIAIGRRDHAHVDLHVAHAAHAPDDLVFQHAQQLGLQQGREFADFVEEERAAVGHLEQALLHLLGVGERALFVAEELGFHQRFRDGRAVDGDEGFFVRASSRSGSPWRSGLCRCRFRPESGWWWPRWRRLCGRSSSARSSWRRRPPRCGTRYGDELRRAVIAPRCAAAWFPAHS